MRPTIRVGLSESGNLRIQAFDKSGTRLGSSTVMAHADKASLIASLLDCQEHAEREDHKDMEWASGIMDTVAIWLDRIYQLNTDRFEGAELYHCRKIVGTAFEYSCSAELIEADEVEFQSLVSAKGDSFVNMVISLYDQVAAGAIRESCDELELEYVEDEWGLTDRTRIGDNGS